MAGKNAYYEKKILNRTFRRTTTAVNGTNASTTNILVTSSTGFDPGDIVQLSTPGSYHVVTAIPDATHITVSPAAGAAPTTGNVVAIAYSPPGLYIGLMTALPTDAGGGTEASGGNYARVQVVQADGSWNAPSGTPSAITNISTPTWTGVTWTGTVVAWAFFDALTGGNMIEWCDSADIVVASGNNVSFNAGVISVSED